MQKLLEQQAIQ